MRLASSTPILTTPDDEQDERSRVLVVLAAGRLCALPVEMVREVIRPRAMTRIPGAPEVVRGLVNVRGMVVTVLDLAEVLRLDGMDPARTVTVDATTERSRRAVVPSSIVLLEHGGRAVGVAVDAVHDVRPLDAAPTNAARDDSTSAERSAASGITSGSRIACGLASAGGDIVTLLDLHALLARVMLSSEEGP